MTYLLDTRVVLWWMADDPQLTDRVKGLIDTEPAVHVSAVSPWEITVKQFLGAFEGPGDLAEQVRDLPFTSVPVTAAHGVRAGRLPMLHTDPFDRMLVAQAQAEHLVLVTRNAWIPQYDVPVMRA
ncbi:type II toxin-antitoxin system VapC family toxin [Streptomyces clavifer]|uniref:type II toxin-antitoxin system VapC family toxin n=1 Tax=Streptomyces TaxID=1883 RepID=UPI0006FE9426|nr:MULTISPECIES: type II toxin-antitoxin system VapC family toxin [Streptomyces]KQZ06941.1 twitching motility protein PilT [Streptomyces sp. Root55]MDX3062323.1 type II toxin-antitoxin system VapC family toxin [Streptomyces sp. ND04-05B]WUC29971.1 type II toxin-antitoxin system VapC family toxin [Streptomyces clavifer]